MAKVRCWIDDCKFWKGGLCSSPEIEIYPDEGCATMEEEFEEDEEEWEEEEEEEDEEEWEEDEEREKDEE